VANTDDVFKLLVDVNAITLKRMENKQDHLTNVVMVIVDRLGEVEEKLGIPVQKGPPPTPN
jgi:hypothetical protein